MKLIWSAAAWDEYLDWQRSDDAALERINTLIRDARRSPFSGLGKPEPLRGDLKGWWSRRITGEHRLAYRVRGDAAEQAIEILQCRRHYR